MSKSRSYEARYCLLPETKAMVAAHTGLAYSVCINSPFGRDLDPDDRLQVALEAVINAAVYFDPSRGFKFSTYASNAAKMALIRAGANNHLIRIPTHVHGKDYEHRPHLVEQAERVARVLSLSSRDDICAPPAREDETEDAIDRERRRDALWVAIRGLPPRTRMIMGERARGKTLDSIGRQMGLSKERIRQIEVEAIAMLRERLTSASA